MWSLLWRSSGREHTQQQFWLGWMDMVGLGPSSVYSTWQIIILQYIYSRFEVLPPSHSPSSRIPPSSSSFLFLLLLHESYDCSSSPYTHKWVDGGSTTRYVVSPILMFGHHLCSLSTIHSSPRVSQSTLTTTTKDAFAAATAIVIEIEFKLCTPFKWELYILFHALFRVRRIQFGIDDYCDPIYSAQTTPPPPRGMTEHHHHIRQQSSSPGDAERAVLPSSHSCDIVRPTPRRDWGQDGWTEHSSLVVCDKENGKYSSQRRAFNNGWCSATHNTTGRTIEQDSGDPHLNMSVYWILIGFQFVLLRWLRY